MGTLKSFVFAGPAGKLEGLWKEAKPPRRGGAVFAHPHPLYGGTLHNKVVYRAAQELAAAGWDTLRFNFRGTGASEGRHDQGQGEIEDYRAALDQVERLAGLPIIAGGFSFGAAVALRAIAGDSRVLAYLGAGLPVATESAVGAPRPSVASLFVVGENDAFGPPARLRDFVSDSGRIVVIEGADHFFEGKLDRLGEAIRLFLAELAGPAVRA